MFFLIEKLFTPLKIQPHICTSRFSFHYHSSMQTYPPYNKSIEKMNFSHPKKKFIPYSLKTSHKMPVLDHSLYKIFSPKSFLQDFPTKDRILYPRSPSIAHSKLTFFKDKRNSSFSLHSSKRISNPNMKLFPSEIIPKVPYQHLHPQSSINKSLSPLPSHENLSPSPPFQICNSSKFSRISSNTPKPKAISKLIIKITPTLEKSELNSDSSDNSTVMIPKLQSRNY
jgi:hypothetical protein